MMTSPRWMMILNEPKFNLVFLHAFSLLAFTNMARFEANYVKSRTGGRILNFLLVQSAQHKNTLSY